MPSLRRKLLKKHGYSCVVCGVSNNDIPLELAHLTPLSQGGERIEDNLTVLCPNCHRLLDYRPLEVDFVNFLAGLLQKSPNYENINWETFVGSDTRFRADILAIRKEGTAVKHLLIECKTFRNMHSVNTKELIKQLERYRRLKSDWQVVLSIPATLRIKELELFKEKGFEVWDLKYLTNHFISEIKQAPIGYYKALFLTRFSSAPQLNYGERLIL